MSIRPKRPTSRSRRPSASAAPAGPPDGWTFLSNHAHVLLCLTTDEAPRLRDVATRVGITERAVQKIVLDLEREGILERRREGRRNRYAFDLTRPLRHPLEAHRSVRALLDLVR
jgi:DNA-binding MarR family transcriptional regulator